MTTRNTSGEVCQSFLKYGRCRWGANCNHKHELGEKPARVAAAKDETSKGKGKGKGDPKKTSTDEIDRTKLGITFSGFTDVLGIDTVQLDRTLFETLDVMEIDKVQLGTPRVR